MESCMWNRGSSRAVRAADLRISVPRRTSWTTRASDPMRSHWVFIRHPCRSIWSWWKTAARRSWCRQARCWKLRSAGRALAPGIRLQTMPFRSATPRETSRTARAPSSRADRSPPSHWWMRARSRRRRRTKGISRRLRSLTGILRSTDTSLTGRSTRTACLTQRASPMNRWRSSLDRTSRTGRRWSRWQTTWCWKSYRRSMIRWRRQTSWSRPGRLLPTALIPTRFPSLPWSARILSVWEEPGRPW